MQRIGREVDIELLLDDRPEFVAAQRIDQPFKGGATLQGRDVKTATGRNCREVLDDRPDLAGLDRAFGEQEIIGIGMKGRAPDWFEFASSVSSLAGA